MPGVRQSSERAPVRLFLTATSLLFVELLLIRWIPANVIYVGFFRNFLLMATFLGIGVGILWGRDPKRVALSPFGPLLLGWSSSCHRSQLNIQLDVARRDLLRPGREHHGADVNFLVLPRWSSDRRR